MNNYKSIEKKLWNIVSVLVSGVLTSIIYDAISNASYVLDVDGKCYVFTSSGIGFWRALGIIILTFVIFWGVISAFIPFILRVKQRFSYDKIRRTSARELVRTLDEVKKMVISFYPVFFHETNVSKNQELIMLHNRDLAKAISLLHSRFAPHNLRMRRNVLTFFRNHEHSSIITIDKCISGYEFQAVIKILKAMVICVKENAEVDKLLESDCAEMMSYLKELEDIAKQGNKRQLDC